MASPQQLDSLILAHTAALAAALANQPWGLTITPEQYAVCASCEAMEETGWLTEMPPNSFNCLGIKAFRGYIGKTVQANGTEENSDGTWTGPQPDRWRVYPNYQACFADQLHILHNQRLPNGTLEYQQALNANNPEAYVLAECAIWSTAHIKGPQVLIIYRSHGNLLAQGINAA